MISRCAWPGLSILLATITLSACTTAPPTRLYLPNLPAHFVNASAESANAEPVAHFWRSFQDVQLDSLVERALNANTDVRSASARVRESRALGQFAEANLFPSVDTGFGASRTRAQDAAGVPVTQRRYAAGLDVLWEVDLFGRLSNANRASLAELRASEAGMRGVQLSVSAEVVHNYFQLRGLQEQLRLAQASLETQSSVLKLVEAREEFGRGSALDTERARALLSSTASDVPELEAALIRTRYSIAVLCGLQPTALDAELEAIRPLPGTSTTQLATIGSPANLLRRRPDIAVAEARVAAAAARAGVARSALFPILTLGGTLGQNALSLGDLGNGASYAYNLGAQLSWNLLDFGRARARISAADAQGEALMAEYERAVLAALAETEGALASYTRRQRQAELLFTATRSSEQAALIARERFAVGSTDFLTVLDAERELLSARNRLVQSQTNAATSIVAVYKALAGGWR